MYAQFGGAWRLEDGGVRGGGTRACPAWQERLTEAVQLVSSSPSPFVSSSPCVFHGCWKFDITHSLLHLHDHDTATIH